MRRRAAHLVAGVLALAVAAVPQARAQYFGQNQVQYRDFDFEVLKTAHFDIYYYPEEKRDGGATPASPSAGTRGSARSSSTA